MAKNIVEPGSTARIAGVLKSHKYEGLSDQYIYQAIAVESSGVIA